MTHRRRTQAELVADWQNLRDGADDALKALGMLPEAIASMDDTPDFIDEVTRRLSSSLCFLDGLLGDSPPVDAVDDPQRMTVADWPRRSEAAE